MAIPVATIPPSADNKPAEKNTIPPNFLPLSHEAYYHLGELGLIPEHTELIDGMVVEIMPKSPLHVFLVQFLKDTLTELLPRTFLVRQESPLRLGRSEPEPDIAIVRGSADDFMTSHPTHAEVIIEVIITNNEISHRKKEIYAAAGIPVLVQLYPREKRYEILSEPKDGDYRTIHKRKWEEELSLSPGGAALSLALPALSAEK